MKNLQFSMLVVSLLAAMAMPLAVHAQESQDAGLTHVSKDEVARVQGMTADYVRTPYGYFHESCVQHVDATEELHPGGHILRADGKFRTVPACAYPQFLRNGTRVEANQQAAHRPEVYNGYLQLVSAFLPTGANQLNAYMTVPPSPASRAGQTLYFFPGLEDAENVVTILQPVLGWDGYGVNNWTLASWNCCESGTIFVGNHIVVKPGDKLYGSMINMGLQSWAIKGVDETQTSLPAAILRTNGFGQNFDWIFAGALETYGVSDCSQFPSSGPIHFTGIQAFVGGIPVANPSWMIWPGSDPETACTNANIVDSKDADISY